LLTVGTVRIVFEAVAQDDVEDLLGSMNFVVFK